MALRANKLCDSNGLGLFTRTLVGVYEYELHQVPHYEFSTAVYYNETEPDLFRVREPVLLEKGWRLYSKLYFEQLDVLIIDQIGKDISGTDFDTNVVGCYHTPFVSGGPAITRIAGLDITDRSHGNANGLGILDFTTRRDFDKFDFENTYPNSLTSTVPMSVKIPMVLKALHSKRPSWL